MRATLVLLLATICRVWASDTGVPPGVEALYPRDGKNTVIVRVDQESDAYVLVENNDGEVGALFLYRYNARTQKAEVLKASETLFPFDPADVRTPPKQVQTALATAWAQHVVANRPGGAAKMTEYWQENVAVWKSLPPELQQGFKAAGVTPPTG